MTDTSVKRLRLEPGTAQGQGKWIFRFVSPVTGKRRDMGLGAYPMVSLAMARSEGKSAEQKLASGLDPIDCRNAEREAVRASANVMNFKQAALKVHGEQKPGWKNAKHADQWINTLQTYVLPSIGNRKVNDLTPSDFAETLRPIWISKPETASRVKQRCHMVMKWCWAHGFIQSNPVDVIEFLLPQKQGRRERTKHHPAMPWRAIPEFIATSVKSCRTKLSCSLLEFVILTAARSGEARAMRWDEVDITSEIWTVPANRMKAKVLHRVPLSRRAIKILKAQRLLHPKADLVFPAIRGGMLSDMILTKFLRDQDAISDVQGRSATAHGFRSSFRDWASENGFAHDLAEKALAHTISNSVEAAYHRTDLLEQRRPMMESWALHITGVTGVTNVVRLVTSS